MVFVIMAPLLLGAVGIGVDFQARLAQKASLQDAADTLALRGARELLLENARSDTISALLQATADKQFGPTLGSFEMSPNVNTQTDTVKVTVAQPSHESFFLSKLVPHEDPIIVDATAVAQGKTNVCVIALEETANSAIAGSGSAALNASKCSILSNSRAMQGIKFSGLSKITAEFICSAGGASGGAMNYSPAPLTDCPAYSDPLAERIPPSVGACTYNNLKLGAVPNGAVATALATAVATVDGATAGTLGGYTRYDLQPGVYCGGLEVNGKTDVHLAPGNYIIKDGPLKIDTGSRLYGQNVGFYLTGAASIFEFKQASIIHLTAPKAGLMAGLLFWEDKGAPENRTHSILSNNARELLGTFYLPKGTLEINTGMPIGDSSAYTAIVSKRLNMLGAPKVVLNTDYSATDIPTPAGVGPTGGNVYLRE